MIISLKKLSLITGLLVLLCGGVLSAKDAAPRMPVSIPIDLGNFNRTYEGVGGIESYGKLLYDYPEPQRSEILDLLFKPGYGASFQILKVEIGSDTNNTTQAIPAHQRALSEKPDFTRGWMWWMMREAKKRNPNILLAALHWGYPGWCSTDELKAQFLYDFVDGAKKAQCLAIDVIGGNQNESYPINTTVTKLLRKKLNAGGYANVRIVASDEDYPGWQTVDHMKADKEYYNAVDIVGTHFKGKLKTPQNAVEIGKPLWSSEDSGGHYDKPGEAHEWIVQMLRLFTEDHFSAIIRWLVTASAYPNMAAPTYGIMRTNEPWSGHYQVGANLWAFAHLTQFVPPGWKIVDTPKPSLFTGKNGKPEGRYIAFTNPATGDFTIIIETAGDKIPAGGLLATFDLKGSVAGKPLHVWRSNFLGGKDADWFVNTGDVALNNKSFNIQLDKSCVYTISTMTGQQKAKSASPAQKPFALPYSDDFDGCKIGAPPRYFVDAHGAFEIAPASGGGSGNALKQVVTLPTLPWHPHTGKVDQPVTEMGDIAWADYKVSADVLLQTEGTALLGGRFDGRQTVNLSYLLEGYWLSINDRGEWKLFRLKTPNYPKGKVNRTFIVPYIEQPDLIVTLAGGKINNFGLNKWINLSLAFKGAQITAAIDGRTVAAITDSVYGNGNIAFSTLAKDAANFFIRTKSPYCVAEFDNLKITPL